MKLLEEFLRSPLFEKVKDVLSSRIGECLFFLDEDARCIHEEKECLWLKKHVFEGVCKKKMLEGFFKAKEERTPALLDCPIGMHLFILPLFFNEKFVGVVGGCGIVNPEKNYLFYRETIEAFGKDAEEVLDRLYEAPYLSSDIMMQELIFVSTLFDIALASLKSVPKEREVAPLLKFLSLCEQKIEKNFFSEAVRLICQIMHVRICSIMLKEDDSLKIVAAEGIEPKIAKGLRLPLGEGLVGHVMKEGKALLIKNIEEDERFKKMSARHYYTKSLLICPIKVGGECKGVINVNNKEDRTPFNEDDKNTLSIIAGLLGERMKKEEEERKIQALQELIEHEREKTKRYREEIESLREKMRTMPDAESKPEDMHEFIKKIEDIGKKLETLSTTFKEEEKKVSDEERERLIELHRARAEAKEFLLLYKVVSTTAFLNEPTKIIEEALNEAKEFFNPSAASYFLLFRKQVYAKILPFYPLKKETLKDIERMMREKVFEFFKRKAFSINIEEAPLVEVFGKEEKVEDTLFSLLEEEKKRWGMLYLYSIEKDAFTPLHKRVFSIFSTILTLSLERAALYADAKEGAEKDELTGTYNFRALRRILEKEFSRAKRYSRPLSLIMLDLDHLKEFNDRFGHHQGNRLIKAVAMVLKRKTRAQDYVARYGGDEFVIILPETSLEDAGKAAERIHSGIKACTIKIKDQLLSITASVGVASVPPLLPKDAEEFLKLVDKALYQAKGMGRDTIFIEKAQ